LAAGLAAATAALGLIAAAAEFWRFTLLLQGRTMVLSGATVRASDLFVAAAGAGVVVFGLAALLAAAVAVTRTYPVAARRLGMAPARSSTAVLAPGRSSPRSIGCCGPRTPRPTGRGGHPG
jgi:hypothetical protein